MAGFEVKVQVPARVIAELAENYVAGMDLPEEYDTTELSLRLAADTEFREAVIGAFGAVFTEIAQDHWNYDITDKISDRISQVGWLAELEQEIIDAEQLAEFEYNLMQESRWALEAASAAKMLQQLGWRVERPTARKRKKKS